MKKNISPVTVAILSLVCSASAGQNADPLLFPKDNFTIETKTVRTSSGEKVVTYRSYMHITYVANPVDKDYQSLNVNVPVKVDDRDIEAANAPILFNIGVGGYMSSSNARSGISGPPRTGGNLSGKLDLALAAGYVVVSPGCRGREINLLMAHTTERRRRQSSILKLQCAICVTTGVLSPEMSIGYSQQA